VADIGSVYVLTQFNSMSLHRHINAAFKFDNFTPSFGNSGRAADAAGSHWYQGTADAGADDPNLVFYACLIRDFGATVIPPEDAKENPHETAQPKGPGYREGNS
jgi:hypothetical protein